MAVDTASTLSRTIAHALTEQWDRFRSRSISAPRLRSRADARFYLGRARRALDRGDAATAHREAIKALQLDRESPWPLIALARSALAEQRPAEALEALRLAELRAPGNGYIARLISEAQRQAGTVPASDLG